MDTTNVIINITSEQETDGGDTMVTQKLPGLLSRKDSTIYIKYEEIIEGVDEKIHTLLKIEGGRLRITRTGGIRTAMDFITQTTTECLYTTGMGTMGFEIFTDELIILVKEDEIEIHLHYTMSVGGEIISVNTLMIKTKTDTDFENVSFYITK